MPTVLGSIAPYHARTVHVARACFHLRSTTPEKTTRCGTTDQRDARTAHRPSTPKIRLRNRTISKNRPRDSRPDFPAIDRGSDWWLHSSSSSSGSARPVLRRSPPTYHTACRSCSSRRTACDTLHFLPLRFHNPWIPSPSLARIIIHSYREAPSVRMASR